MIGKIITDPKTGLPMDNAGNMLAKSPYQPSDMVKELFARDMVDYQLAWTLQHRPLKEFDGYSLLERTRMDQETFGAHVGAEFVPQHKKWRWKGRKNTARNKLIGILAHMIAGMLFPAIFAQNDEDEEDKVTAQAMRILVESWLKKAKYEVQFLFIVLGALVNPAVFVQVEYVEAFQTIKNRMANGQIKLVEAVDELMSGLMLNIVPVDEILLPDFWSGASIQSLPSIIRVRRISYDSAKSVYGGSDNFQYVQAGQTRIVMASTEGQVLYDVPWTEADGNYVQEITIQRRPEDLETVWVGGVFMGNEEDIYNNNPMSSRRFALVNGEWMSVPVYNYAKAYFEPIDPTGRFFYGKSGAFKEYWDALSGDRMHQIAHDGTFLDVIKPVFLAGVAKMDSTVMVPGATVSMPAGATMSPYNLGPNLQAAIQMMNVEKEDMSESTQDKIMSGQVEKGVTAYATSKAEQNARVFLGVFGVFIAELIKEVGELTVDNIIMHGTVGELDASSPGSLRMKYKTVLAKSKEQGKDLTHKMIFSDRNMGRSFNSKESRDAMTRKREWELFEKAGGKESDMRIWEINPYRFARTKYSVTVDSDKMVQRSMGTEEQRKQLAFNILTDPRVAPFTDQEAVVTDFAIEPYSDGDPEKYKRKGNPNDMMAQMGMTQGNPQGQLTGAVQTPQLTPQ